MRINDNIASLRAYTNLLKTGRQLDKAVGRLSSGYKINSVSDDSAGMAVSKKLKNQINGMDMAGRNTLDGISLVETADGALNEVHAMLHRIRELAVYAAHDTNEPEDREKMQDEIDNLFDEINDTAYKTEFNTIKMLSGEAEALPYDYNTDDCGFKGIKLQIGANKGLTITLNIPDIRRILDDIVNPTRTAANIQPGETPYDDAYDGYGDLTDPDNLGSRGDVATTAAGYAKFPDSPHLYWVERINVLTVPEATLTIDYADEAIAAISKVRSQLGAYENRLIYTEKNLNATKEHTSSALSRIKDADMALEMTYNAQFSVINQAGIAILGQANARPQQILQLLR